MLIFINVLIQIIVSVIMKLASNSLREKDFIITFILYLTAMVLFFTPSHFEIYFKLYVIAHICAYWLN